MKRRMGALIGSGALVFVAPGQEPRPAEVRPSGRVSWSYETAG